MSKPVLEFHAVSDPGIPGRTGGFESLNLRVNSGECVLLDIHEETPVSLAPLVTGVSAPTQGTVRKSDVDWSGMTVLQQEDHRSRIRVQVDNSGWLSNLNMFENIVLGMRHHSDKSESMIVHEAECLAGQFGLQTIPDGHPHQMNKVQLRRCGWIRLGMGKPELICVEWAAGRIPGDELRSLFRLLKTRCEEGAAVLLLLTESAEWLDRGLEISRRMHYDNGRFGEKT